MSRGQLGAVVLSAFLVLSVAGGAVLAAAPPLDFDQDEAVNPYVHASHHEIDDWDRGDFGDDLTKYYDDDGDEASLNATVNATQDEQFRVNVTKAEVDAWQQFPRISDEGDNTATWTNDTNWTTTASGGSASVTDEDGTTAGGVPGVGCSTSSMTSGDTAACEFSQDVDISSDVDKRTAMVVMQVNDLSGDMELRFEDGSGNYYYATLNTSANATKDYVAANETGVVVFQETTSNLLDSGTTPSSIQKVVVHSADASTDVTIVGLDVERKGTFDIGETVHDFDGDGDDETQTISEVYDSPDRPEGAINITEPSALGSEFDDATLHDVRVWNVRFELATLLDDDEYSIEFSDADSYGSYPEKYEVYADLELPTAIDLSYGSLTMEEEQTAVSERYATVEVASDIDSSEPFGNLSDSDYTSQGSNYDSEGKTVELVTSPSSGNTQRYHAIILLQDGEADALQSTGAVAGGPTGDGGGSGGGIVDLLTSIPGMIVSGLAGVLGLRRLFGSGG
jgi:hypothetical protein